MSREIIQKIEIKRTAGNIYAALLSPSSIIEWWQALSAIVVKENNGIYAVSWGNDIDDPDYVTISYIRNMVHERGFTLEYSSYHSKSGNLPFDANMTVDYKIIPITKRNSILEIHQKGIPDDPIADEYFEGCTKGWIQVLDNIKHYCEKG